jgi:hypothetical protein
MRFYHWVNRILELDERFGVGDPLHRQGAGEAGNPLPRQGEGQGGGR